jgi:hypothetical protein
MKLLVNTPVGTQEIIAVGPGGQYFEPSRVLWDERVDGPLPSVILGAMRREGSSLVVDEDLLSAANSLALSLAKESKLKTANAECDRRMSLFVASYPEREQQTFTKQEEQARAYLANSVAVTPLLDMLATERGLSKAEMAARIMAKVEPFEVYCGRMIGYRQRLEDQLDGTETLEELSAIDPTSGWPE